MSTSSTSESNSDVLITWRNFPAQWFVKFKNSHEYILDLSPPASPCEGPPSCKASFVILVTVCHGSYVFSAQSHDLQYRLRTSKIDFRDPGTVVTGARGPHHLPPFKWVLRIFGVAPGWPWKVTNFQASLHGNKNPEGQPRGYPKSWKMDLSSAPANASLTLVFAGPLK